MSSDLEEIKVNCEVTLPIKYRDIKIDTGYRIDMLVEKSIILENKCMEKLLPVQNAQLLTNLKLSGCHLGFLINWNSYLFKDGIKRMVQNLKQ